MAWTAPKTWVANARLLASELNTHLRDNLLALYTPPTTIISSTTGYSTSSTSYVDVNAALEASITTTGGRLLVTCRFAASPTFSAARLLLDGSEFSQAGVLLANNAQWTCWTDVLVAGTHTIKPQWYVSSGSTTMTNFYLAVREVS